MIIDVDLSVICGGMRRTYINMSSLCLLFVNYSSVFCLFFLLLLLSMIHMKKSHAYFSQPSSSQCDANRLAESKRRKKERTETERKRERATWRENEEKQSGKTKVNVQ